VPIGSPTDIRVDGRGLRTVTRFNRSPLAESVLEAIRGGDVRGYSFRGPIFKSNPNRVPKVRAGAALPTIVRTELGLVEYGPTPTPAYADAGIMAVRSLLEQYIASTSPRDQETRPASLDPGPGTEEQLDDGLVSEHSGRHHQLLRLRAAMRDRGLK